MLDYMVCDRENDVWFGYVGSRTGRTASSNYLMPKKKFGLAESAAPPPLID